MAQASDTPAEGGTARRSAVALIALMAFASVVMAAAYLDEWASPYEFTGDATQHVWWTYRFADRGLFPGDPAADFFSLPLFAPPGYQALYRVFVPVVDAQRFSETIPVVLMAVTVLACFVTFRRWCGGAWLGPLLVLSGFAPMFTRLFRGGLPRTFGLPVAAAFLWLSCHRRVWPLGVGLLLAVLFYPPPVLVLGLTSLAVIYVRRRRRDVARWDLALYLCVTVSAAALILACHSLATPGWVGRRPTPAQFRTMDEFRFLPDGRQGRAAFYGCAPGQFYLDSNRSGLGSQTFRVLPIGLLGLAVLAARRFRDPVPVQVPALAGFSLLMYGAAMASMPLLFYPNRHVRDTLPLALLATGAVGFTRLAAAVTRRIPAAGRAAARLWWLPVLALLVWGVDTALEGIEELRTAEPPDASLVALADFCRATPKDTLFAGYPSDMDDLPMLARRSVLASSECTLPHYLGYYETMLGRLLDELHLLFATDWDAALALARRHGVDYVVVPGDMLSDDYGRPYAPHDLEERRLRAEARASGAALLNPPPGRRVLRTPKFDVVDVRPEAERGGPMPPAAGPSPPG
jgi:uncharacterized membrane protein (UPF0136 family)